MKSYVLGLLLLTSCTATEVGNTLLPDEFTYGQGSASSSMSGKVAPFRGDDSLPMTGDTEGESSYAALTWHLPSLDAGSSREERSRIRSESLLIDELVKIEEEHPVDIMASGGTLRADWRHAAGFGGIMLILLIILLVKLRRSNGWH